MCQDVFHFLYLVGGDNYAALTKKIVVNQLVKKGRLKSSPLHGAVASVSVGIFAGKPVLDLDYAEDSGAEVDANFVICKDGRFVEVQSTAEGKPFSRQDFDRLSDLAFLGITQLLALWEEPY